MTRIEVVGAVIVDDGRVLCTQRDTGPLAGRWEFPGGKLEPGESAREALAREIREELSCEVDVGELVTTTDHAYEFADVRLTTFYCTLSGGRPQLSEHRDARWLIPDDLDALDWAPADLPAVAAVRRGLAP